MGLLNFFAWRWLRERFHNGDNIPIFRGNMRSARKNMPTYRSTNYTRQEPWGQDLLDYMIFRNVTRNNKHR